MICRNRESFVQATEDSSKASQVLGMFMLKEHDTRCRHRRRKWRSTRPILVQERRIRRALWDGEGGPSEQRLVVLHHAPRVGESCGREVSFRGGFGQPQFLREWFRRVLRPRATLSAGIWSGDSDPQSAVEEGGLGIGSWKQS